MKRILKRIIEKNIVKILVIFNQGKEKVLFSNKNYLDDTIYFKTKHLIELLKERNEENERRGKRISN